MSKPRNGFTLTELLVVIVIISLLISLLVPTISKVRQAAWAADTQQRLNNIRNAIERYYNDFQQYPGLYSNPQISAGVTIDTTAPTLKLTMTENGLLSLLGGVVLNASSVPVFSVPDVGRGQVSFNTNDPRRYPAYVDVTTAGLPSQPWTSWFLWAKDNLPAAQRPSGNPDCSVPEFFDAWPSDPMPIIYLRAKVAATGIIDATGNAQYDLRHLTPYLNMNAGTAAFPVASFAAGPGYAAGVESYFADKTLSTGTVGTAGTGSVAKQKDGYILIAAGPDRIFGTADDQTNFGKVK